MLELAERLGAAALATGHYARVVDDGAGPLLAAPPTPPRIRPTCSPRCAGDPGRAALPARRADKPEVRSSPPSGPAGRRQAREPGPLLPRRRGQALLPRPPRRASRDREGEIVDRAAASSAATAATTTSPSASAAASVSPPAEPLYVLATDAGLEPGRGRPARGAGDASGSRSATRCCFATAPRRPGQAPLPLAPARLRSRAARRPAPRVRWSWPSPPTGSPRPDRVPDGRRDGGRSRHDRELPRLRMP